MSGPLDELREMFKRGESHEYHRASILAYIDAFAAQHPGLVDHTEYCAACCAPLGDAHHTAYSLFDNIELFHTVFGSDHDAYDRLYCVPLCDECFCTMKAEREWHAADVRPLVDRLDKP